MRINLPREPQRILIVKPSALGDIVHTLPVLHLLRKRYKTAEISWLVVPAFATLLENHHLLDHLLLFERRRFANLWRDASAAKGLMSFSSKLRQMYFDMVIDLQGLFRSGWIAWQTRAAVRIGFAYAREGAPLFYTHKVQTRTREQHAIERYLDICEALDCGRGPVVFDFDLPDSARQSVQKMTQDAGEYAVILPGTNWQTKRWPAERFEALIQPIRQRFGLSTIIAGGNDVTQMNRSWESALDLSGKTDLKQLVALIEGAKLVIANDSGPMHIASALNRPLVTIFGPTNPIRTGPYERMNTVARVDIACSPCYSRHCIHQSCMMWLDEEMILTKAAEALNQSIQPVP